MQALASGAPHQLTTPATVRPEGLMNSFRAEFFNIFNRTYLNNPDSGNPAATTQRNAAGVVTAGFGRVNPASTFSPPRNGQVVARFQF